MFASVTDIIPDLYDPSKVSGRMLLRLTFIFLFKEKK